MLDFSLRISSKRKPLIIDVGANIGMVGILFSLVSEEWEYEGYEPHAELFHLLQSNLDGVGQALNFAVGECSSEGWLELDSSPQVTGSRLGSSGEGSQKVLIRDLSSVISGRDVDLLKIDIEGAEYDIFSVPQPSLMSVNNLYLEVHPHQNKSISTILQELEKYFILRIASSYLPVQGFSSFSNIVVYGKNRRCE